MINTTMLFSFMCATLYNYEEQCYISKICKLHDNHVVHHPFGRSYGILYLSMYTFLLTSMAFVNESDIFAISSSDAQHKEMPWWKDGRVILKVANIHLSRNHLNDFIDTVLPAVQESLHVESVNQKVFHHSATDYIFSGIIQQRVLQLLQASWRWLCSFVRACVMLLLQF
jgi:hypothetical protein